MPETRTRVYRGWHGLGFRHPVAGYVCAVFPRADAVEPAFEHGAELGDPCLVGTGRTVRSLVLRDVDDQTADVIAELVERAVSLRSAICRLSTTIPGTVTASKRVPAARATAAGRVALQKPQRPAGGALDVARRRARG